MTKINFENLPSTNTPINATNLNQLQTNVENGILSSENKLKNEVLWTGNESDTTFNAQFVNVPTIGDYDFFIIYAFRSREVDNRTVACIVEKEKPCELIYTDYYNGNVRVFSRRVDNTALGVSKGFDFFACYINGTSNNGLLIPYKIVGFKYYN